MSRLSSTQRRNRSGTVCPRWSGLDGHAAVGVDDEELPRPPVGGDAELASFPTAYVTAERMLRRARVGDGDTILVTGASGGVGTGLVQLAKRRGAWVVAVVGTGKEDAIRAIGADAVIARCAPLTAAAQRELGARPLDVVADVWRWRPIR